MWLRSILSEDPRRLVNTWLYLSVWYFLWNNNDNNNNNTNNEDTYHITRNRVVIFISLSETTDKVKGSRDSTGKNSRYQHKHTVDVDRMMFFTVCGDLKTWISSMMWGPLLDNTTLWRYPDSEWMEEKSSKNVPSIRCNIRNDTTQPNNLSI